MKIAILGSGYVGLVTGVRFSELGLEVICIDIDEERVARLQRGELAMHEPGFEELLRRNTHAGGLRFTTSLVEGVQGVEAVFIAVETPIADTGQADLQYVLDAALQVARAAKGPLLLVTKSTMPVGTADRIRRLVAEEAPDKYILVASNPEFLREGDPFAGFFKPERIVIGADDNGARMLLERIYRPFILREHRVIFMDTRSAELTQYGANAIYATCISFMNEMAALCEQLGANIDHVRRGIASDGRIGEAFLYPGVDYGGFCCPKEIVALSHMGASQGLRMQIINAADDVNRRQRGAILEKLIRHFEGDIAGKTFAIWGLSITPRTDDIREGPAITFIEGLLSAGAQVVAFDPAAVPNARAHFGARAGVSFAADEYAAVQGAHALILMTEWTEFQNPDWSVVEEAMQESVVFDGRNLYVPEQLRERGFAYYGIGR